MFVKTYRSLTEAGISTDTPWQNIQCCCNGRTKYAKGYIWRYHGDKISDNDLKYVNAKLRKTAQCDAFGNIINVFDSANEAAKKLGFTQTRISYAIRNNKKYKGFYWKRVDDIS